MFSLSISTFQDKFKLTIAVEAWIVTFNFNKFERQSKDDYSFVFNIDPDWLTKTEPKDIIFAVLIVKYHKHRQRRWE